MTRDEALAVLATYREAREQLHAAVRSAHDADVTQAEIIRLSGLSREGVRKILARHDATSSTATD